jgi:hypothetical protein
MIIWEIKAQALRLMFADTDVNFSYAEFEDGTIYSNSNTREKLMRMNDSIARAIDLYYFYNKEQTKIWENIPLRYTYVITQSNGSTYTLQEGEVLARDSYGVHTIVDENGALVLDNIEVKYTFYNELDDTTKPTNFSFPTRIDLLEDKSYVVPKDNVTFYYDEENEKIFFYDQAYASYESDTVKLALKFRVYYKIDIININTSTTINDLTYNVTTITKLPEDVQRMIPYFVKGELYEEDEPDLARAAKQEYLNYMIQRPRKTFTKVQTKVKSYTRSRGE